jgi:3',5'-cyclic AMP phosphodiesterase CpdA
VTSEAETLILRFRDLATDYGETIKRHHAICAQQGRVWWGWWHKAREHVPVEAFEALNERAAARDGGLPIYLFNAHQRRIHAARLTKIHWSPDGEPQPSSYPELTPAYYRGRRCKAWFQLSDLSPDPLPFSALDGLAQVSVPEFFRGEEPPEFTRLHGVEIGGPGVLDEQNRTIWFARQLGPGEAPKSLDTVVGARREVSRPVGAEANFPREFFQTRGRRLLWLSDLHFAKGAHREHHGFAYQHDEKAYRYNLHHEIERVLDHHEVLLDVEGLLVSGDLTWKSDVEEFREAGIFLRELVELTGRPGADDQAARIAMCPGNHDLRFSAEPWRKDAPITAVEGAARRGYEQLYRDLFGISPNEYLCMGRRFLLGGAIPVEVVCLNSSLLQQTPQAFQGHGFIGEGQLRHAARAAGWSRGENSDAPRAIRIVVVHHHLLPVIHQLDPSGTASYSTPLDAERLANWVVEHRVDLVLHGHMHEPFCVELHRGATIESPRSAWHHFTVVGLGSTGVSLEHRSSGTPNLAATLLFNSRSIEIEMFEILPSGPVRARHAHFEIPIRRGD